MYGIVVLRCGEYKFGDCGVWSETSTELNT